MIDNRFVCKYPQYKFCGKTSCPLAKYCNKFPKISKRLISQDLRDHKKNAVKKQKKREKNMQENISSIIGFLEIEERKI